MTDQTAVRPQLIPIPERVAAGAAFLDEHDPDWWRADVERAIDLETLNLESSNNCILGQRCPLEGHLPDRYMAYGSMLAGIRGNGFAVDAWARPLGFQADPDSDQWEGEYDLLTVEWSRVIRERRSA